MRAHLERLKKLEWQRGLPIKPHAIDLSAPWAIALFDRNASPNIWGSSGSAMGALTPLEGMQVLGDHRMLSINPTSKDIFVVVGHGWRMLLPQGSTWCPESLLRSNLHVQGAGVVMNPPDQ